MNATNRLILRRIGLAVLTLWLVSMVVFALTSLLPGDAADEALGQGATAATVNALRVQLGLDQPAWHRYLSWLTGLLSGDPGEAALGLGAGLSRTACDASGLAHLRQYFRPAGFSSEQRGQIMEISREGMLKGYHH